MAILAAKYAEEGAASNEVLVYVKSLVKSVQEYVFIDQLKYLVAGGRVSKPKGFFGDLLHKKPIISPEAEGVRKHGTVKNRTQQLDFALDKLQAFKHTSSDLIVLLQYTDNREWLQKTVESEMMMQYPDAEILLVPLSLSSGVHMGPGTWSIAFAEKGCRE
jgi:DegV family protein with EDD domain